MNLFIVQRLNYALPLFFFLRLGQSFVWLGVLNLLPYRDFIKHKTISFFQHLSRNTNKTPPLEKTGIHKHIDQNRLKRLKKQHFKFFVTKHIQKTIFCYF